jgi:hypothetical protein
MKTESCGCGCKEVADTCKGGFQKPKGHLDTQMYPECEGGKFDRNIVKKTEERRKKDKRKRRKLSSVDNIIKEYIDITKEDDFEIITIEAKKKKEWNPNPFAVCTESVGREDKEKYERCVLEVKKKQKKAFNLKEHLEKLAYQETFENWNDEDEIEIDYSFGARKPRCFSPWMNCAK